MTNFLFAIPQVYPIHGAFWEGLPREHTLVRASSVRSVSSVRLEPALRWSGGGYEGAERAAVATAEAEAEKGRGAAAPGGRYSVQDLG